MDPPEKHAERVAASQHAVLVAAEYGMQPEAVERLLQLVLGTHVGAVGRCSIKRPPADVKFMWVQQNWGQLLYSRDRIRTQRWHDWRSALFNQRRATRSC